MAYELLGPSFDIHGGGIDLAFPHHENEVAQSRCAHPEGTFANIWMHNGFLNVEGEKMSKSLGNFFTVRDLLDRGIPGEVIRFVLLSTHYRQPIDWTGQRVKEAEAVLSNWTALTMEEEHSEPLADVVAALANDLDTASAITAMHAAARDGQRAHLLASMLLMGVERIEVAATSDILQRIEVLLSARNAARQAKDYAKSDTIRGLLQIAGVIVEDGKSPEWRLGFDATPFGWMTASRPIADGKSLITREQLKKLAEDRQVHFTENGDGHWIQAGFVGQPRSVDQEIIELAEREANA
jgi:cysteinyl-tRNA synthetase